MMNTLAHSTQNGSRSQIGRIVWKDAKRLAPFFVAMVALAVIVQGVIVWTIRSSSNDFGHFGGYAYGVLGGFAALFAAACAATSFAAEKEERTFDILQLLPLKGSQLLIGKLLAATVLGLVFLFVASVVAMLWVPSVKIGWQPFLAAFAVGTFEFFAWSLLFSVLLRSPINAALAGIFCASASAQISVYLINGGLNIDYISLEPYALAWKPRLAIAVLIFAVTVWKAKDWLSSSPTGGSKRERRGSINQTSGLSETTSNVGVWNALRSATSRIWPGRWLPLLYRLSWQSFRENWIGVALAYSLTVSLPVIFYVLNPATLPIGLVLVCMAGGFAGVAAFSSDVNRRQLGSSFLAIHGASPNVAWLSRVTPWVLAIVLLHAAIAATILVVFAFLDIPIYHPSGLSLLEIGSIGKTHIDANLVGNIQLMAIMLLKELCIGSLLCFFAGSFLSIVIRSRAMAMVATALVCLPLVLWAALMLVAEMSILTTVFPLIVAFALAGWFAFRSRLMERLSWKRAGWLCGALAILPAVLVPAVTSHRANEIPAVEINLVERDLEKFTSPETEAQFEAIRVKFSEPLAKVEWPSPFVDHDFYYAIAQLSDEELKGNDTLAFYEATKGNAYDRWRLSESQKPAFVDLKYQTENFLDEHSQQISDLHNAIDFAFEQLDLFDSAPALSFGEGKKEWPIPDTSTCRDLLRLEFERNIHQGKPQQAWRALRSLTKYRRMKVAMTCDHLDWYSHLLDHYQVLASCKNQTPKILLQVIDFASMHLQPMDWERVLEYERARLLHFSGPSWTENHTDPSLLGRTRHSVKQILKALPSEQQRTRRLIDLWTLGLKLEHRSYRFALQGHNGGDWRAPDKANAKLEQFGVSHRSTLISAPRNTIVPRVRYGSVFEPMQTFPDKYEPPTYIANRNTELELQLTLLQLKIIKAKLHTGEFPSSIDSILISLKIKEPVYYYPEGRPNKIYPGFPFNRWNILGHRETIPAHLPFLSNRIVSKYPLKYEDQSGTIQIGSAPAFGKGKDRNHDLRTNGPLFILPLGNPNSNTNANPKSRTQN